MPELPEVETIRRGLQHYLVNKTLKAVEVRVPKLFIGDPTLLVGADFLGVERRAKVLIFVFDNGMDLLVHLKMTGQLVYQSANETEKIVGGHPQQAYNQPMPHSHTHVILDFTDGSKLFFNDLRKFGWMHVLPHADITSFGMLKTIGPEPLEATFTIDVMKQQLMRYPNRIAFVALLDQSVIAGLGNIYVNEALYEAGIHPERKIKDIRDDEWKKLWLAIRNVLEVSLSFGGTSDNTYVDVEGNRGDYLTHAHVYHKRKANPCGHDVERKKIGGRTAHFCALDQI